MVFVPVGMEMSETRKSSHNCHLHRGFYITSALATTYLATAIYTAIHLMSHFCARFVFRSKLHINSTIQKIDFARSRKRRVNQSSKKTISSNSFGNKVPFSTQICVFPMALAQWVKITKNWSTFYYEIVRFWFKLSIFLIYFIFGPFLCWPMAVLLFPNVWAINRH